jgi:hypothetical protein
MNFETGGGPMSGESLLLETGSDGIASSSVGLGNYQHSYAGYSVTNSL